MKETTAEDIERLIEIKETIEELMRDAEGIVRGTSEEQRARSYWMGHILGALDDSQLCSSMFTMQNTIDGLEEWVCSIEEE